MPSVVETEDKEGSQGGVNSTSTELILREDDDVIICVGDDDKGSFEKGEPVKGVILGNVLCNNPKRDELGYDSGEDFIG